MSRARKRSGGSFFRRLARHRADHGQRRGVRAARYRRLQIRPGSRSREKLSPGQFPAPAHPGWVCHRSPTRQAARKGWDASPGWATGICGDCSISARSRRSAPAVVVIPEKIGCGRSSEPQETETGGNRARQPHGAHGPCSFEEWNGIPGGNTRLNKIGAFSPTEKASAS